MARLYHPAYEHKRDRVTRVLFTPAKLDGRMVAAADVTDAAHVADLLARGWRVWPGTPVTPPQPLPGDLDALTVVQIRQLASDRDVALGPRGTKAELIAALRDAAG